MTRLSILIPTYNGAEYLEEQIDSILRQTDPDFELVMVDDGSTDDTPRMLEDLARRDGRIRVLPSDGNYGQNARIAQLIGEAGGDYIAIGDQDDIWEVDRNKRLFAAMGALPMVFGRSELIDKKGRQLGASLLDVLGNAPDDKAPLRALFQPMFSAHATIMRRDWVQVAALSSPLPFDWLWGLDALFSEGLAYEDDAIVYHRIHGGNQVNNVNTSNKPEGLSSSYVRWLLFNQQPSRMQLWLACDYLGRSLALDPVRRRMFRTLGKRAHDVWFSEWRSLGTRDGGLKALFEDSLLPLAGTEADGRFFVDRMAVLTKPLLHAVTIRDVWQRHRASQGRARPA